MMIQDIIPAAEPSLFEFSLDLNEVEIINRALAMYVAKKNLNIGQLDNAYDLLQGFTAAYMALRTDEEARLGKLL